jgi:transcriptional regulator with XRE-family HTH domain
MRSFVVYEYPGLSTSSEKLVPRLSNREYRHAYMMEGVKSWIARQVRALREQRGWSQGDLARESGKRQSAISRIEDPDYGQLTLQTLFDLAQAFDIPLLVQFAEWPDWLNRMEDVATEWLQKESFNAEELSALSTRQLTTVSTNDVFRDHIRWNVAFANANMVEFGGTYINQQGFQLLNSVQLPLSGIAIKGATSVLANQPIEAAWEDWAESHGPRLHWPSIGAPQFEEVGHG